MYTKITFKMDCVLGSIPFRLSSSLRTHEKRSRLLHPPVPLHIRYRYWSPSSRSGQTNQRRDSWTQKSLSLQGKEIHISPMQRSLPEHWMESPSSLVGSKILDEIPSFHSSPSLSGRTKTTKEFTVLKCEVPSYRTWGSSGSQLFP